MQFSFTLLILTAVIAFAGGYVVKSSQETGNQIETQSRLLSYQMVTLGEQVYRVNRFTGELHRCGIKRDGNGEPSKVNCSVSLKR